MLCTTEISGISGFSLIRYTSYSLCALSYWHCSKTQHHIRRCS